MGNCCLKHSPLKPRTKLDMIAPHYQDPTLSWSYYHLSPEPLKQFPGFNNCPLLAWSPLSSHSFPFKNKSRSCDYLIQDLPVDSHHANPIKSEHFTMAHEALLNPG